jgi:hypothetical protein
MARIKRDWGAAIEAACRYSSIPPEFVAALIANESGGNSQATRFEPRVFERLQEVRNGTRERYGAITRDKLFVGTTGASPSLTILARGRGDESPDLRLYASSLGLTQIMGYQALAKGLDPRALVDAGFNLEFACRLLAEFADCYGLDVTKEFAELFRCWNGGGPYSQTHDPEYVPRGLERMKIYAAFHSPEAKA